MTRHELLNLLLSNPLVASVQASDGSPVDDPHTLSLLAKASTQEGVNVLRLQGVKNILACRAVTGVPIIGLIKRNYEGSEVYITPTEKEVDELVATGCEVIALDGTRRKRPGGSTLDQLVTRAHQNGAIVLADVDSANSARFAIDCGADLVGTTLSGYTKESPHLKGPDLETLRALCSASTVPVVAEGRYAEPWQVEAALRIGARAVVIGGALNDPIKTTRRFAPSCRIKSNETIGAVDIGGTWMRFATFSSTWGLLHIERMPLLEAREDRLDWIRGQIARTGVKAVGVSSGGTVDPATGELWEAKAIIPDHVGTVFSRETLGVPTVALNDGLASAWGHACLAQYAGKRVATLALGTGVGCGFVADGKIVMGPRGEYPRLNDMPGPGGASYEQMLGGAALSPEPTADQMTTALKAFLQAGIVLQEMYFPDQIVVCGAVGFSKWLSPYLQSPGLTASPFGLDAGLYGAAALALYPSGQ